MVYSTSFQEYEGSHFVLTGIKDRCKRLKVVLADIDYGKSGLPAWAKTACRVTLQTVPRIVKATGFVVLPKRWVVECTFAWMDRHRRLSTDYERLSENSEAVMYIAMIDLMSRRLA